MTTSHHEHHTQQGIHTTTQDHNADMHHYIATQTPRLLFVAQAKLRAAQNPSRRDRATLHKSILLLNTIFSAEDAAERERAKEEDCYNRMANFMGGDDDDDQLEELEGWDEEMTDSWPSEEEDDEDDAADEAATSRVEIVEVEGSDSDDEEEDEGYDLSDDEEMDYSFSSVSSADTSPTPISYAPPSLVHSHPIHSPTPTRKTTAPSFYDDNNNFSLFPSSSSAYDPLDPFVSDDDDDELVTPPQAMHDSFGDDDEGDFGGMEDEEREALEGLQLFSMRAC